MEDITWPKHTRSDHSSSWLHVLDNESNLDDSRAIPKRFIAPRFLALTVASSRWLPSANYSFLASPHLYGYAAYGLKLESHTIRHNVVRELDCKLGRPAISSIVPGTYTHDGPCGSVRAFDRFIADTANDPKTEKRVRAGRVTRTLTAC